MSLCLKFETPERLLLTETLALGFRGLNSAIQKEKPMKSKIEHRLKQI